MEKTGIMEIAKSIKGHLSFYEKCSVTGVSIDSRTIKKGDIFFAIKGERYNGHNFIKNAISKGAVAIVVSHLSSLRHRRTYSAISSPQANLLGHLPSIFVKNTIRALQDFAEHYRKKFDVKIIGITGSNGKTTTKDILASIIAQKFPVFATQGNLNNHIGLPLTLFNLKKNHKYCVLEMGANQTGEIARLCRIADPFCGIITNISSAHIGNFGTLKNIVNTKIELFNYLNLRKNIAVVNNDDEFVSGAAEKLKCNKMSFGIKNNSDIMASGISSEIGKTAFILKSGSKKIKVKMPICGIFNVYNALAAAACAVSLKIPADCIARGIKNFIPQKKRMEIIKLRNEIIIINDSYNANPASMYNAIENFSKIFYNKRKILVLGDMLELGRYGIDEHKKLGLYISENKPADTVYTIGELSKNISGIWFGNKNKLLRYLKKNLKRGDAVLFKASRKLALEEVVNSLISNL